ncbi:hypothetical protein B0T13DRAFT_410817 [Neurospora crassa]|nr:hypothetical protein B0T13DRAFT_410817 [Neurospora crassa]
MANQNGQTDQQLRPPTPDYITMGGDDDGMETPRLQEGIKAKPKRIIVCCDGTWMDSLGKRGEEPPSNVTRISRVLRRTCYDGTHQVIAYVPGVGTSNKLDSITGGAFGMGLDQDIREVYNFICTNYVDGDEIFLIGFSRGAFTARSTADMIASLGILMPDGLDRFYSIFHDYMYMGTPSRNKTEFVVPNLPEYKGQKGQAKIEWEAERMKMYKEQLIELGYTRDKFSDKKTDITIKALGVWDTVGALGIPPAPVIGVRGSSNQWAFTHTQISDKVEHAFQALALDEPRYAFRPALWERLPGSKTNLKQVWFPGTHANVGGGWYDQQIADITLAWMCDQLSTLGVEFNLKRMHSIFLDSLRYSAAHPFPYSPPSFTQALLTKGKSTISKLLTIAKPSSLSPRPSSISIPSPISPRQSTSTTSSSISSSSHTKSKSKSHSHSKSLSLSFQSTVPALPWALPPIFHPPPSSPSDGPFFHDSKECTPLHIHSHPPLASTPSALLSLGARPWGLGTLRNPANTSLATLAGRTVRRPGLFLRVDEDSNIDTPFPLLSTGETIHSSVRVRLTCGGLGPDDKDTWTCDALLKGQDGKPLWKLERGWGVSKEEQAKIEGFVPREVSVLGPCAGGRKRSGSRVYPTEGLYEVKKEEMAWRWVYIGDEKSVQTGTGSGKIMFGKGVRFPDRKVLAEEPVVGYWERYLLGMLTTPGERDVWRWAAERGMERAISTSGVGDEGVLPLGEVSTNQQRLHGRLPIKSNGNGTGNGNGNASGKGHTKAAHSVG